MLKLRPLLALLLLPSLSLAADSAALDATPSDASIHELLDITHVQKMIDNMRDQMDGMMDSVLQQSLKGKPLTPQAQAVMHKERAAISKLLDDQLSWAQLQPMYLDIYRKSLSQDEVDGMLAFYKTKAGQAVINKMPLILQNTMSAMQKRMGPMMRQLQAMQAQIQKETEAAEAAAAATPTPAASPSPAP